METFGGRNPSSLLSPSGQDCFKPVPYSWTEGLASLVSRGIAVEPPPSLSTMGAMTDPPTPAGPWGMAMGLPTPTSTLGMAVDPPTPDGARD